MARAAAGASERSSRWRAGASGGLVVWARRGVLQPRRRQARDAESWAPRADRVVRGEWPVRRGEGMGPRPRHEGRKPDGCG